MSSAMPVIFFVVGCNKRLISVILLAYFLFLDDVKPITSVCYLQRHDENRDVQSLNGIGGCAIHWQLAWFLDKESRWLRKFRLLFEIECCSGGYGPL